MAVKVDLSGLNNFKKRLQNINSQTLMTKILNAMCIAGKEKAESLYGSGSVTLSYEISGNIGSIIANGEKVAYLEYGTGIRGEQSNYEGNLPTQAITFDSKQYGNVTTNGWTYYYAYQQGLSQKQWSGRTAQSQMWQTARYLQDNAKAIITRALEV